MGMRIEVYLDIASYYSYVAFLDLQQSRNLLTAHGVEVEYHPVLIGAINQASGNKPPTTLPAKAVFGAYDTRRAMERVGSPPTQVPEDFFGHAKTVVPLRALHYIKQHHSRDKFETTLAYLFDQYWAPPNVNLTQPPAVAKALASVPQGFQGHGTAQGAKPLLSKSEVEAIMQGVASQNIKDKLKATTQEALDRGAFGCPWLWVTNSAGKAEPFFGSDRFHHIYKYLGLPFQEIALLPPAASSSGKSRL